jgi:16S rRNA A1518/A1519 N6-dimethyltransferase RsmA/KsgA/DIM1 with predicted DNA glycosylase/AP lyase activity
MKGVNLGTEVLEIGPGFGATTALLTDPARRLACVEVDKRFARSLGDAVHRPERSCYSE